MTVLDAVAAVLVVAGGLGAYWAYRRSLASFESLGEAAAELPPPLEARDRAELQGDAHADVAELNALAARLAAGEKLSAAEHAHVASLVRELELLEHRAAD